MSTPPGTLSDEDVRQITLLLETLERSTFDYLQVELGDLKVTLGKGAPPPASAAAMPPALAAAGPSALPAPAPGPAPSPIEVTAPALEPKAAVARIGSAPPDGGVEVVAPMLGRFYASPEPGAPAFASLGTEVGPDSTLALIEVMKVFTAIRAGVEGVVTEICVQNEQYVEYGQILFRIRPGAKGRAGDPSARKKDTRKGSRR